MRFSLLCVRASVAQPGADSKVEGCKPTPGLRDRETFFCRSQGTGKVCDTHRLLAFSVVQKPGQRPVVEIWFGRVVRGQPLARRFSNVSNCLRVFDQGKRTSHPCLRMPFFRLAPWPKFHGKFCSTPPQQTPLGRVRRACLSRKKAEIDYLSHRLPKALKLGRSPGVSDGSSSVATTFDT